MRYLPNCRACPPVLRALVHCQAYKIYYPGIPTLTNDEVKKHIAEENKWFEQHQKKVKAAKAVHSSSYEVGYKRGYQDGEDDGAERRGYQASSDKHSSRPQPSRKEYERGYADGYEAGYNDY